MNPHQKKLRMIEIAERDGLKCYICNKPWSHWLSDDDVEALANKYKIQAPKHLNGTRIQWLRSVPELAIKKLKLEHKNNVGGDEIANLGLACQSCNIKKNPPSRARKRPFLREFEKYTCKYTSERKEAEKQGMRIEFKTVKRNVEMEPRFEKAGNQILTRHGAVPRDEFIIAACQDAANDEETIMPITGEKYYRKRASRYAKHAIWEEFEMGDEDVRVAMVRMKAKKS